MVLATYNNRRAPDTYSLRPLVPAHPRTVSCLCLHRVSRAVGSRYAARVTRCAGEPAAHAAAAATKLAPDSAHQPLEQRSSIHGAAQRDRASPDSAQAQRVQLTQPPPCARRRTSHTMKSVALILALVAVAAGQASGEQKGPSAPCGLGCASAARMAAPAVQPAEEMLSAALPASAGGGWPGRLDTGVAATDRG